MLLRNWLKQTPHPTKVLGFASSDDDAPKTVRIGDAKSRWRDAELALKGCVRCEALNVDGESLRVWEDETATPQARAERAVNRSDHNITIVELSKVITESNRDAVNLHADAYRMGWETLLAIVKFQGDRMQALERAWHKVVMKPAAEAEGDQAPALDQNTQMILTLLAPLVAGMLPGMGGGAQPTSPQQSTPPQKPQPKRPNGAQ